MAQTTDITPDDGSGADYITRVASSFSAIFSKSSGTADPPVVVAFMDYVDSDASPVTWFIYAPDGTTKLKVAELTNSTIKIFSEGAPVLGAAVANILSEKLTIDKSGAAGELDVGSTVSSGVFSRISGIFHDAGAADTIGYRLEATVVDATNGSEDASLDLQVMRAGTLGTMVTFAANLITIASGITLNAPTLQQGGVGVTTLIDNAVNSLLPDPTTPTWSGTTHTTLNMAAGFVSTFTGASPTTLTVQKRTQRNWVAIENTGTANITLASAASPNAVTFGTDGLVIAPNKIAFIRWRDANADGQRVRVTGENT